jgi:hypothetical protein
MAVLMISHPWKHSKAGVYYFRLSIPEDLRPFAKGGREEPSREYKRSLGTKDPRTAKRLYPDVAARCDEHLSELRARKVKATNGTHAAAPASASSEPAAEQSREALAALAAELAHQVLTTHSNNPGPDQAFRLNNAFPPGPWGTRADPRAGQRFLLIIGRRDRWQPASAQQSVSGPARAFLGARGVVLTAADWETFCELARDALDAAYETLQRRYRGDLSDAPLRERFPLVASPAARPKVSLRGLVDVWAKVRAGTKSRSLKKYTRWLRELSEFLGHDDALAVTSKDLRRWRDHLKEQGRHGKTINDDCVGVVITCLGLPLARRPFLPSPSRVEALP